MTGLRLPGLVSLLGLWQVLHVGEASTVLPGPRCLTVKQGEMMIAVLIDARMPGSSGWVAVRHARKIKVIGTGLGDEIRIHTDGDGQFYVRFSGDRTKAEQIEIPHTIDIEEDVSRVRAEILKVGEGSRISIDLE